MRISYVPKKFGQGSLDIIRMANVICAEYQAQGLDITLRQLYYQFVSRDWLPNKDTEYKRLGSIINDARLAGLLDWKYIVDRTRNLRANSHWDDPAGVVESAAHSFMQDKWADQDHRVEVWIEKDALVGVLQACCPGEDVPYFSCRGYTSQSEVWGAAQRLGRYIDDGKKVVILHLGDHDPSGIDMTRDIEHRLAMFIAQDRFDEPDGQDIQDYLWAVEDVFEVQRIGLTWQQIQQYDPPPNPAKMTDARARGYIQRYGPSSWELDALEPTVLVDLIRRSVALYRDEDRWEAAVEREETERKVLTAASERWDEVRAFLNGSAS